MTGITSSGETRFVDPTGNALWVTTADSDSTGGFEVDLSGIFGAPNIRYDLNAVKSVTVRSSSPGQIHNNSHPSTGDGTSKFLMIDCTPGDGFVHSTITNAKAIGCVFSGNYSGVPTDMRFAGCYHTGIAGGLPQTVQNITRPTAARGTPDIGSRAAATCGSTARASSGSSRAHHRPIRMARWWGHKRRGIVTAQSPPRFTPTISLGNILAVATALFSPACTLAGFAYGYGVLSSQQAEITRRIDQIENSQRDRETGRACSKPIRRRRRATCATSRKASRRSR